jgi:hypothetical protein
MRTESALAPTARRRMSRILSVPSLAASVLVAGSTFAQSPETSGAGNIDDVMRRLEQLEQRNSALEGEVKTLREADGEAWLTEQRARQIRSIVTDTLADADTRASLQSSGMTAGWDDGFFLASPDGRFKLEVGGLMQFRYMMGHVRETPIAANFPAYWADGQQDRRGFENSNTELWLSGHLFGPGLTYMLRGRFTNDDNYQLKSFPTRVGEGGSGIFTLQDAWARFELDHNWYFRAGQFRLPFLREELVDQGYQLAVDRSVASNALGLGFTQGLEIAYVSDFIRGSFAISDGAVDNVGGQMKLVTNIQPTNRPFNRGKSEFAMTGRVEWKPYGDWQDFIGFTSPPGSDFSLMFGLGAHWQSTRLDYLRTPVTSFTNNGDNQWLNMTADVSVGFGGASVFSSITYSYIDSEAAYYYGTFNGPPSLVANVGSSSKWAWVLQGSMYVAPKFEVFSRYELGQLSFANSTNVVFPGLDAPGVQDALLARENHLSIVTAGVNWYLDGHDVKFTGDFGYALDSVNPSWFAPQLGWRVSQVRDQWVARLQLQIMF